MLRNYDIVYCIIYSDNNVKICIIDCLLFLYIYKVLVYIRVINEIGYIMYFNNDLLVYIILFLICFCKEKKYFYFRILIRCCIYKWVSRICFYYLDVEMLLCLILDSFYILLLFICWYFYKD